MLVNHILIGAGRSGTTTLTDYLRQHNQIHFSSIKEVTYFSEDDKYERGQDYLHSFFSNVEKPIIASSDTYLLMSKKAPKRIHKYNPAMKLAVILRTPIERTFSAFKYALNHNYISPETILLDMQKKEIDVLQLDDIIKQNNHAIFEGSLYYKHLNHWLQWFDKDQIFICTTDQLAANPQALLNDYCDFIDIDRMTIQKELKSNVASVSRNKQLNEVLMNREHPIRKMARPLLKIDAIRKLVIKSGAVDRLKTQNQSTPINEKPLSKEEIAFCKAFFKKDLELLKSELGIEFSDGEYA